MTISGCEVHCPRIARELLHLSGSFTIILRNDRISRLPVQINNPCVFKIFCTLHNTIVMYLQHIFISSKLCRVLQCLQVTNIHVGSKL